MLLKSNADKWKNEYDTFILRYPGQHGVISDKVKPESVKYRFN